MKIKALFVSMIVLASCAPSMALSRDMEIKGEYGTPPAVNFIEGSMGYQTFGVRGGRNFDKLELSAGYFTAYNQDELSSDVRIHVLDVEVGRWFALPYALRIKPLVGIGYAIPNVTDGPEKADNSHAWILGVDVDYPLIDNWSIGGSIKGLFFNTDIHRETFTSHLEVLSNGMPVEVLDEHHDNDSKNFNDVLFGVTLKYRF